VSEAESLFAATTVGPSSADCGREGALVSDAGRVGGLDSMACYTKAFKCVVSDISPAMAAQIKRIAQAKAVSGPSESRFALEVVPLSQDALKLAHWFDGLPAGAAKAQALADCMRVVAGCLVEAGQSAAHGADAQAKTSDAPRPGAPVVRKMPVSKRIDQGER